VRPTKRIVTEISSLHPCRNIQSRKSHSERARILSVVTEDGSPRSDIEPPGRHTHFQMKMPFIDSERSLVVNHSPPAFQLTTVPDRSVALPAPPGTIPVG
jgi:hypothetical protein